jgi:hypothetical protein
MPNIIMWGPAAWHWWISRWVRHPVQLISGWIHAWWAVSLLRDPEPIALVHKYLELLAPLPAYGAVSLGCTALYILAGMGLCHRYIAHTASCCFWSFVAALFISSGASITGQGVYLTLAVATGFHALIQSEISRG